MSSGGHHHRTSLGQRNKAHKVSGGHSSSRELRKRAGGRVGLKQGDFAAGRKARSSSALSQRNAERGAKRKALMESARLAKDSSKNEPPLSVIFVPVTKSASAASARRTFAKYCHEIDTADAAAEHGSELYGYQVVNVPKTLSHGTLQGAMLQSVDRVEGEGETQFLRVLMSATKGADLIVFVFASDEDPEDADSHTFRILRIQGVPTALSVYYNADDEEAENPGVEMETVGSKSKNKQRNRAEKREKELKVVRGKILEKESMGSDEVALRPHKIFVSNLSNPTDHEILETKNAVRLILSHQRRSLTWRAGRSYLYAEQIGDVATDNGSVSISGYVRGSPASANYLVHIGGYGTYAVRSISSLGHPQHTIKRAQPMNLENKVTSVRDETVADDPRSDAEVDPLAGEQTWPDLEDGDHEEENRVVVERRKQPKGWSEYQAAWIAEDEDYEVQSDLDTDGDVTEEKDPVEHDDMEVERNREGHIEVDASEHGADDNMDIGEDLPVDAEEVQRSREHDENERFPDEVDVPLDRPARERFARYRGLKSFRTSPWDPKELLPKEYATVHQYADFRHLKKRIRESEKTEPWTHAKVGEYVTLVLEKFGQENLDRIRTEKGPIIVYFMHKFENKRTVLHIGLHGNEGHHVKGKDELIFQTGFVQFKARPVFSEVNANCDKHKLERFLHPGRFCAATVYGPSIFAPAPAIAFKPDGQIVGTGSVLSVDPDRIVLKRIVLTGYPFRIHKKRAVVRFMFFNPEDIRWFKPVELFTKLGRSGHILEPLGTHGYMKCIFDGPILHHDTVCMYLYKRVYPRLSDA
uniref:Bms1-type G domain-containing protein n=2 Tax=Rhodosorus marinus TaxID=101924 RepID=A0A7S3AC53_9RHOD|mmetsp:Transcript_7993/g.35436  ORF Transcript_7993/g.35436 Transcript_7993/m.35436 type:complete len:812 (+) Transcript_7993:232-2667(+)